MDIKTTLASNRKNVILQQYKLSRAKQEMKKKDPKVTSIIYYSNDKVLIGYNDGNIKKADSVLGLRAQNLSDTTIKENGSKLSCVQINNMDRKYRRVWQYEGETYGVKPGKIERLENGVGGREITNVYDIKGWDPCEIDEWVTSDGSTVDSYNNDRGILKRKVTSWSMNIGIDRLIYNKLDVLQMKNIGSNSIFPHIKFKLSKENANIDYISTSWCNFSTSFCILTVKLIYSLNLLHNNRFVENNIFALTLNKYNYLNYSNVWNDLQERIMFIKRSFMYRSDLKLGLLALTSDDTKNTFNPAGILKTFNNHNKILQDAGTLNFVLTNPKGFITSYMIGYTNDHHSSYSINFRTRLTALTLNKDSYIEKIWGGGE